MSQQPRNTRSRHSILSACAVAMAVSVMAATTACTKAPEAATHDAKSMPSGSMDHAKMDGMKHMDGMSMTGDVDHDFAANMRMHHQMAVDMSEAQLKNGTNPEMRQMAEGIIAAQKKEIAELDQWLEAHKKS